MVNNSLAHLLGLATPALASLLVACASWWTAPSRAAAAISVARAAVRRWIPAMLIALISAALGVVAYAGHAPGLSAGRAIEGIFVAVLASVIAMSGYWLLGRLLDLITLVVAWGLGLVPLYYYAGVASLVVIGYTQCGAPGISCPLG